MYLSHFKGREHRSENRASLVTRGIVGGLIDFLMHVWGAYILSRLHFGGDSYSEGIVLVSAYQDIRMGIY